MARKEQNCHTCKRACHLLFLKVAKDLTEGAPDVVKIIKYGENCPEWYDIDAPGERGR